jgi:hypothetical protein
MNHPNATLENVLTFMWYLWKCRNDNLFNKKPGHPNHIYIMANSMKHNLELVDVLQVQEQKTTEWSADLSNSRSTTRKFEYNQKPPQGHTVNSDLMIKGTKIFCDVAWKTKKAPGITLETTT